MNTVTVNGSITVDGQLYGSTLAVSGSVSSTGGKVVWIDSSTISGSVSLASMGSGPANLDSVSIEVNEIGGNLVIQSSSSPTGDMLSSTNTVQGNEVEAFDTVGGDFTITAETVTGSMVVFKNVGAGDKEVDGNIVGNFLVCLGNQSPFEAHGNSAKTKLGNC